MTTDGEKHHAGDAGVGHDLGLGQRRTAHADAPGGDLASCDVDRLVHLRDGPQRVAMRLGVCRERCDVRVEDVQIEHERGRAELGARARQADQALVGAAVQPREHSEAGHTVGSHSPG